MSNYHIQNGCWNCKFVFIYKDYDCPPEFYCTNHFDERPECGSVLLKEDFCHLSDKGFEKKSRIWDNWAEKHRVHLCGICDEYVEKSKK